MRKIQVHLSVESCTLRAAEIEALVGLAADESWSKGDTYLLGGKQRIEEFSRWSILEDVSDDSSIREAATRIVKRLENTVTRFLDLPAGTRTSLAMYITEFDAIFGFGLDAESMKFFSKIGAELDVSVVVKSVDNRPVRE